MKIGILGAGGCFAQCFVRHLASEGIECFGIGRSTKSRPFWNVPSNFRYSVLHLVTQLPEILNVLDEEKPDIIVNYAAQGEGAASFGANAPDFFTTNATALIRLVLAICNKSYIERFIQIGSSEVYGAVSRPAKEIDYLYPTSPYSISKAAFDQYLGCMWRTAKFPMNIIRPSNCYVEGQQLYRIIPKAMLCALKKEKLPLHGNGVAQKSYLHADDLSEAVLAVIRKGEIGEIYNVGPDMPIAIWGLVMLIAKVMDVKWGDLVQEVPDRVGQDSKYHLDSTKMRDLGWEPKIKLWQGLEKMASWIQTYPELLTMPTTYEHRP